MQHLNYPPTVDPARLIGRVMGPDTAGAMYECVGAEREISVIKDGRVIWLRQLDGHPVGRTRASFVPLFGGRLIAAMQARENNEHGEPVVPEHLRTGA